MRKILLKILGFIFIILSIIIFIDKTKDTKFTFETEYSSKYYNPLSFKIIEVKKEYDFKILLFIFLLISIFLIFNYGIILRNIKFFFEFLSKTNNSPCIDENKFISENKEKTNNIKLLSDKAIENKKDDVFGTYEKSNNFANIVYNYGEKDGYIFGLIADWGEGKTTFLNFFKQNNEIKNNCIVFDFNPWYFSDEADLLNKLLNQFKNKIGNEDLSEGFLNLINFLQENTKTILGLNFNLFEAKKDLFEIKEDINKSLKKIDKKIIIIIDDLDRISNKKIKIIFKIIDLCRDFYNTNFIICYDPNNFNYIDENLITEKSILNDNIDIKSQEIDNSNYISYISKIINIEYHLNSDFSKVKEEFYKIFEKSELFSEESKEGIKNGIDELFTNENFRVWGKYIGNLRQIKRLYNNFIVYKNSEISGDIESLFDYKTGLSFCIYIKMRLILLYYPKLYKNIYKEYNLENGDSDYFIFSLDKYENIYKLKYNYSEGKYFVNEKYLKYLETLKVEEREILKNIFNYDKGFKIDDIKLKNYLNIFDINPNFRFERFKMDKTEELIKIPKNIKEIFLEIEEKYGLKGLNYFLTRFAYDENYYKDHAIEVINYILNNFSEYSINGLNNSIGYIILNLLEKSSKGEKIELDYIYNLFYGKDDFKDNGIIKKLFYERWGIIGVYIISSIISSLNSHNSKYYNIFKALGQIEDLNKPNKFYLLKFYRYIFNLFKENYIDRKINIFEEIFSFKKEFLIIEKKGRNHISVFNKKRLLEFIMYQFSFNIGYFDHYEDETKFLEFENQNFGIRDILNDYYFEICFSGDGIKYFLKYLFLFRHNRNRVTNEKFYDFNYLFEVFNQEKFDNFIEKEKNRIDNFIIYNENIKKRWRDFLIKYNEFKKQKSLN